MWAGYFIETAFEYSRYKKDASLEHVICRGLQLCAPGKGREQRHIQGVSVLQGRGESTFTSHSYRLSSAKDTEYTPV